jgi:four helix bundle protein
MLHYEQLDVYQCAKQFAALSFDIIERMPKGNADLSDQLKRATISILLKIAEGSAKTSTRDRASYYAIARGSAMECSAVLDVLQLLCLVTADSTRTGKDLAERIVAMLTRMTRRWPAA